MKCQEVKKRLFLFVGDDLPEKKKESVESHLKQCPTCLAEVEKLKSMKESLQEIARLDLPETLPPDFPQKVTKNIQQKRAKFLFFPLPKPVRVAGICAASILLVASAVLIFLSGGKMSSERLVKEILTISRAGSSELVWDPEHIFFKAFDGPYRLDAWEAPDQPGVYAVLHKTTSDTRPVTYVIDYCGHGRDLSSFKGYPWIQHRMKRLVSRTGSKENVFVAVYLMPDSSKWERRQIEEALLKAFDPYFNRGV
jgi:hypothetical protein